MGSTATATATVTVEQELELLRRPLLAYCYRMLGSLTEAEDAVQEAMVRAWRSSGRVRDRDGLRPWMYRIATNVCIDALNDRKRRALPMDLTAASDPHGDIGPALPESTWVQPFPSGVAADPSEEAVSSESVRLAFIAALQYLQPRQRAVLILRDVLCWKAAEVAELLDTSVDAVNSSLRRARAVLARAHAETPAAEPIDTALLQDYVSAFQRFDIDGIVALLHHDVVIAMPPHAFWLRGRERFATWMRVSDVGCLRKRMVRTEANGCPAVAIYQERGGRYLATAIQVLEVHDGRIAEIHTFLQAELFPHFGLPLEMIG
ncbi:sigma-70 family RNA polymerase sigma factor [Nocardia sp. SYP-A9097]|uniref:RNA polymerase subunit sigma-70 n=1 Tax=Nocardia sp. SYP-A9097 TaxID=2663237 RepID=UPI00129A5782|nr:RNA polymerase subunit sigma-70 [Nocardia sp. SYP-A9097]MRH88207.1 sigma-70 family RNA polymerase sigma factor [Nocardia sp. SYP-A9097]